MNILVFDIGGTAIKYGNCIDNTLCNLREIPTEAEKGGAHILNTLISIIEKEKEYDAIGISTAGQVHAAEGYIIYANQNIPGYTGIRIQETLEERFHVPVAVENDVNAAALGEAVFGSGRDFPNFLMLTYGTGVGGASVMNGSVYYGSSYSASEFGAMITHSEDRLLGDDYFDGCYEKYASTTALVRMAMEYDSSLDSGKKIFQRLNDENVLKILDCWVDEIMLGLATLVHIYNPSSIILGGGIMEQPLITDLIHKKKERFIMPSFSHVAIKPALLGNKAGLLGANHRALTKVKNLQS